MSTMSVPSARPPPMRAMPTSRHTLLGRHVKRAFPIRHSRGLEHMGVAIVVVRPDGTLVGRLANDSAHAVGYLCGDLVSLRAEEIEAIYED
jgi:hypothetical protein